MLQRCAEDDFYSIKMVAFDRLRPDGISVFFWGTFIFSGIMTAVLSFGSEYSIYVTSPVWPMVVKISTVLLAIQFVIAIFFTNEKNAYRFQKLQSILLSIISLKMSFDMYPIYFLICEDRLAPDYMKTIGLYFLIGGITYLLISTIRGIRRVQQGELRKGGRGLYNFKESKGHVSLPIIFGATMLGGAIIKVLSNVNTPTASMVAILFMLLLTVILQYTIAFAWPEFFLYTYCKFRFESFQLPMPKRIRYKQKNGSEKNKK